MEFMDVIAKRRTTREFSERAVEETIIRDALEAAFMAPTYDHLRSWYFVLVDDPEIRLKLTRTEDMRGQMSEESIRSFDGYEAEAREMYLYAIPRQARMILEAPELAIVAFKPKRFVRDAERIADVNCVAAVWCCIENFMLALAERGVMGVTCVPGNTEGVKAVLRAPADYEIAAIIPFGYPKAGTRELRQRRIAIEDRLRFDSW
jgi:Nitroreductase